MAPSSSKPLLTHQSSSTAHYQTFPTQPPNSKGRPPSSSPDLEHHDSYHEDHPHASHHDHETPLPKRQLAVLAVIALAEQTALNSISPYLPEMTASFPGVTEQQVGLYVGLIASAFALAQFATNFLWGWLSDRIGRKPVVLLGTVFTAANFVAFGFCRTLWQAIIVQALMGLLNGNAAVISTCLGEITDRSNQSKAFTYLPVIYGIGGITGPIVGGLLANLGGGPSIQDQLTYPYLLPNIVSASVLVVDLIVIMFFLEESLESVQDLPPLGKRVSSLFVWLWQFTGFSHRPTYARRRRRHYRPISSDDEDAEDTSSEASQSPILPALLPSSEHQTSVSRKDILNRDMILILVTYFVFQLSNVAFNALYPIFAQRSPPIGRSLSPEEIGFSLAFAGVMTIFFQVAVFEKLKHRMGNKSSYRMGLAVLAVAFFLMPWIGYKDRSGFGNGKVMVYIELGVALIVKTIAAVGGLSAALLLITNSAPDHAVLGSLNGLAQTLSAAGRAAGPFIAGSIFSLSTRVQPKGEALAFGLFGGICFLGFLLSFGIRGASLESSEYDSDSDASYDESEDDEETAVAESSSQASHPRA